MRLWATLKSHEKLIFLSIVILVVSFSLIAYPYYYQFSVDCNRAVRLQAKTVGSGFVACGMTQVDASGISFDFVDGLFNVTAPGAGCKIEWLNVAQDEEIPALFDTVVYNTSGKVSINLINVNIFRLERTDNGTANLRLSSTFNSSMNSYPITSFLPNSWFPLSERIPEDIVVKPTTHPNTCDLRITGETAKLFLSIGAKNGRLEISGNDNYSVPITNDYVGILLEVTTPHGGSYTLQVTGDIETLYLQNWHAINYFMGGYGIYGSLYVKDTTGHFYYGQESKETFGTENLNFSNAVGNIRALPELTPDSYQVSVTADVYSIVSSSAGVETVLAPKSFIPYYLWSPFPLVMLGLTLLATWSLYGLLKLKKRFRWDVIIIFATIWFCVGSLIWAMDSGQPFWLQNILSLAPLFVTITTYLAEHQRHGNPKFTRS